MPRGEKNRKLTDDQRLELVDMYETPLPDGSWCGVPTIARHFGVTNGTIRHHLKKAGVVTRTSQQAYAGGKRTKPIKNLPVGDAPRCRCGCGTPTSWNQRKNGWNVYADGHYRADAPYKHREWLYLRYVVRNMTLREMAEDAGVSEGNIGRHMERLGIPRRDMSAARIGRQTGANNPAWKGGVAPERQKLYKTPEWKTMVQAVWKRDGFRCVRCGAGKTSSTPLHAHHIVPWADDPEKRAELYNLLTLCKPCHTWVHSRENVDSAYIVR